MAMPFASSVYKYLSDYYPKLNEESSRQSESPDSMRKTTYYKNQFLQAQPSSLLSSRSSSPLSDIEAIRIKATINDLQHLEKTIHLEEEDFDLGWLVASLLLCACGNEHTQMRPQHTSTKDVKFMSIDPNITSYATLYLLLQKAFHIKQDFDVSYLLPKSSNTQRPDVYLSLTSDWDLDAAFHTASYPLLELKIETVAKIIKTDLDSWDLVEPINTPLVHDIKSNQPYIPLTVSLKYDLTKKIGKVFDVFHSGEKATVVGQQEWSNFFDSSGRIYSITDLKVLVYHGGLDPSLRQEAWPHLLGVYPLDLSYEERTRYLFMKTQVYKHLRENWMAKNPIEIKSITHMVQKDVLRTDRTHPFFNVREDHPNLVSLFNILTTFALNNPEISYCQGMSDLAAPLLVVTQDETLAYLCFCKVMGRLRSNFLLKGTALMRKFSQLSILLMKADEPLFTYLEELDAGNFYFCYRMLLLEMKREFPFSDAMRVMETIWSSVPQITDDEEAEVEFYKKLVDIGKRNSNGKSNEGPSQSSFEGLPNPCHLNDGSPFPLFMCLATLLLNKEQILECEDYTMLAMHFDKLSRKNDASKVLEKGKILFAEYLKAYLDLKTANELMQRCLENSHGTGSTAAQC